VLKDQKGGEGKNEMLEMGVAEQGKMGNGTSERWGTRRSSRLPGRRKMGAFERAGRRSKNLGCQQREEAGGGDIILEKRKKSANGLEDLNARITGKNQVKGEKIKGGGGVGLPHKGKRGTSLKTVQRIRC